MNMKTITIYLAGEKIAKFENVHGLMLHKDGKLEILSGETWLYFDKDIGYDCFYIF